MLLITPQQIVSLAFTPRENIDPLAIRPLKIDIAQQHFILPRLGNELFETLKPDTPFVTQFIQPALAHFVRYLIVDELAIQLSNTGALIFSSSESECQRDTSQNDQTTQTDNQTKTAISTTDNVNSLTKTLKNDDGTETNTEQTTITSGINTNTSTARTETTAKNDSIQQDGSMTQGIDSNEKLDFRRSGTSIVEANLSSRDVGQTFRAASSAERRIIRTRALLDANILLDKAVRSLRVAPATPTF